MSYVQAQVLVCPLFELVSLRWFFVSYPRPVITPKTLALHDGSAINIGSSNPAGEFMVVKLVTSSVVTNLSFAALLAVTYSKINSTTNYSCTVVALSNCALTCVTQTAEVPGCYFITVSVDGQSCDRGVDVLQFFSSPIVLAVSG
jgi:hypothetical protein